MSTFFSSIHRCAALLEELDSWEGTPFQRSAGARATKGVCADCVSFVAHALANIGAVKPIQWPQYVVRGGGEAMLELLVHTLAGVPNLRRLATLLPGDSMPTLEVGDVLLLSSGRAHHHLAIYSGQHTIWHATEALGGVGTGNILDPAHRRLLRAIYRVHEPS